MIASAKQERGVFILLSFIFILAGSVALWLDMNRLALLPFALLLFYFSWQNLSFVFYLLLLALPFSFEYNFTPSLGTDIPDEFLMLFTSFLFLGFCIYHKAAIPASVARHPLLILLIIYTGWIFISVIFSTNPLLSAKFLLAKGWYAGAFVLAPLILFKEKKKLKISSLLITGAMLLVTFIALVRHSRDGFSFATINDAVSPFFRNHVNYSAMLVCIIPLLIAFFYFSKTNSRRSFIAGLIVIALAALFFSYARGAWLALVAGIITYGLIRKRILVISYILFIAITLAALFWLKGQDRYLRYAHDYQTTIFHKNFNEHLVATYKLKDLSSAERFYRWIAGVRMIKDNWLTGYGPNTFYDHYKGYAAPAFKTWVSDNKEHSTVHNYFLLVAVEQGLPGLLIFVVLLGAMLYYAQYLYARTADKFYKIVAITTGVMLVMIITVNCLSDLIETDKIGSLFFLCMSALVITDIRTRNSSEPASNIKGIS